MLRKTAKLDDQVFEDLRMAAVVLLLLLVVVVTAMLIPGVESSHPHVRCHLDHHYCHRFDLLSLNYIRKHKPYTLNPKHQCDALITSMGFSSAIICKPLKSCSS